MNNKFLQEEFFMKKPTIHDWDEKWPLTHSWMGQITLWGLYLWGSYKEELAYNNHCTGTYSDSLQHYYSGFVSVWVMRRVHG